MTNYWIYDIETLKNLFVVCFLSIDTKEEKTFIIYKEQSDLPFWVEENQIVKLREFLKTTKGLIGFNNIGFDYQVLHQLIKTNITDTTKLLQIQYDSAQLIISNQDEERKVLVWDNEFKIPQLDLFLIWHLNNRAKSLSLKALEFSMDFPNIEEMPIHHNSIIEPHQIDSVVSYCLNDIRATYQFYLATIGNTEHPLYKGVNKLNLRQDIFEETGLNCFNWDNVKIGENLMKQYYCKETGTNPIHLKELKTNIRPVFTFKECFPDYMKFETLKMQQFIESFQDEIVPWQKDEESDAKKWHKDIRFGKTTYTIALGGIHSNETERIITPKENEILRDADVGSQYPNEIRKRVLYPLHLSPVWNKNYQGIIEKRIEAKGLFKKTKEGKYQAIQEAYKESLNGGSYGKLGEKSSWQYCQFTAKCVTIGCQIEILMLIEQMEMAGISVYSANT